MSPSLPTTVDPLANLRKQLTAGSEELHGRLDRGMQMVREYFVSGRAFSLTELAAVADTTFDELIRIARHPESNQGAEAAARMATLSLRCAALVMGFTELAGQTEAIRGWLQRNERSGIELAEEVFSAQATESLCVTDDLQTPRPLHQVVNYFAGLSADSLEPVVQGLRDLAAGFTTASRALRAASVSDPYLYELRHVEWGIDAAGFWKERIISRRGASPTLFAYNADGSELVVAEEEVMPDDICRQLIFGSPRSQLDRQASSFDSGDATLVLGLLAG